VRVDDNDSDDGVCHGSSSDISFYESASLKVTLKTGPNPNLYFYFFF